MSVRVGSSEETRNLSGQSVSGRVTPTKHRSIETLSLEQNLSVPPLAKESSDVSETRRALTLFTSVHYESLSCDS